MKILENVIFPADCEFLSNTIHNTYISAKQSMPGRKFGDKLVDKSASFYSLHETEDVLWHLTKRISEEVGKPLVPTYSYCRIYFNGAILPPHTDREACEYSLTLKVSGDNWPIWFDDKDPQTVTLANGQGVLYKGLEVTHWREPFKGSMCTQAFFHWVDPNGPYAEWRYDKRQYLDQPAVPR